MPDASSGRGSDPATGYFRIESAAIISTTDQPPPAEPLIHTPLVTHSTHPEASQLPHPGVQRWAQIHSPDQRPTEPYPVQSAPVLFSLPFQIRFPDLQAREAHSIAVEPRLTASQEKHDGKLPVWKGRDNVCVQGAHPASDVENQPRYRYVRTRPACPPDTHSAHDITRLAAFLTS